MRIKRLFIAIAALIVALCMCFSFAACGADNGVTRPNSPGAEQGETGGDNKQDNETGDSGESADSGDNSSGETGGGETGSGSETGGGEIGGDGEAGGDGESGGNTDTPVNPADKYTEQEIEQMLADFEWCRLTNGYIEITGLKDKTKTEVIIPDCVASIGRMAMKGYHSLVNVIIPNSVIDICDFAFGASGLINIDIPDSVKNIGIGAFMNCNALESVTMGNGVISIGHEAFNQCYNLSKIKLSNSLKYIERDAFRNCPKLTHITIPNSVISIGNNIVKGCDSLVYNEYDNALYLGNEINKYIILVKAKDTDITSCNINRHTKFIHSWAFNGCTELTNIVIPDSVVFIGKTVLYLMDSNLTDVYYTGTQEEWERIDIGIGNGNLTNATIHYNYVG